MHQLASDIRLAIRRARKRPGFTVVALLSLTLGIGANTAVFSLVNAILLRRAPIPHPEQIAEVYQHQTDFPYAPFSYPDYVDFRRATAGTFSQVSISMFTIAAHDMGDHVESLTGELVNGDYFPLLGLRADGGPPARSGGRRRAGRASRRRSLARLLAARLRRRSERRRTHHAAVGSAVHDRRRRAEQRTRGMISGIAPALFAPIMMINQLQPDVRDQLTQRGNHAAFLKARLAPGASIAQATRGGRALHGGHGASGIRRTGPPARRSSSSR